MSSLREFVSGYYDLTLGAIGIPASIYEPAAIAPHLDDDTYGWGAYGLPTSPEYSLTPRTWSRGTYASRQIGPSVHSFTGMLGRVYAPTPPAASLRWQFDDVVGVGGTLVYDRYWSGTVAHYRDGAYGPASVVWYQADARVFAGHEPWNHFTPGYNRFYTGSTLVTRYKLYLNKGETSGHFNSLPRLMPTIHRAWLYDQFGSPPLVDQFAPSTVYYDAPVSSRAEVTVGHSLPLTATPADCYDDGTYFWLRQPDDTDGSPDRLQLTIASGFDGAFSIHVPYHLCWAYWTSPGFGRYLDGEIVLEGEFLDVDYNDPSGRYCRSHAKAVYGANTLPHRWCQQADNSWYLWYSEAAAGWYVSATLGGSIASTDSCWFLSGSEDLFP